MCIMNLVKSWMFMSRFVVIGSAIFYVINQWTQKVLSASLFSDAAIRGVL